MPIHETFDVSSAGILLHCCLPSLPSACSVLSDSDADVEMWFYLFASLVDHCTHVH